LLCNDGTACNADGTTFDGVAPFTTANDLSTPNPAYFERADGIIKLAAANGMVVILDPIENNRLAADVASERHRQGVCFRAVPWKSLQEFSQYHLHARQRLSDMARRDRRRTGSGSCAWHQKCGFKPYPYSRAELFHERFFGGPIMGTRT